jgi:tetratricopeptide (TPR) repeat protein
MALRYSRRLLEKSHLLLAAGEVSKAEDAKSLWTFQSQNFASSAAVSPAKHPSSVGCVTLAVMYLVEALLLAGKSFEAQTLLSGFVSGNIASRGLEQQNGSCSEPDGAATGSRKSHSTSSKVVVDATTACGGLSPQTPMGGLTPPWTGLSGSATAQAQKEHESKGDGEKEKSKDGHATLVQYPATEMPKLGETQCMLYTNLAALHAQDGNLAEAERCCEQALRLQPSALAPVRTMVYLLIRRGKHAQALERLRQTRVLDPKRTT